MPVRPGLCPPPDQFSEISWWLAQCDYRGHTRDSHSPQWRHLLETKNHRGWEVHCREMFHLDEGWPRHLADKTISNSTPQSIPYRCLGFWRCTSPGLWRDLVNSNNAKSSGLSARKKFSWRPGWYSAEHGRSCWGCCVCPSVAGRPQRMLMS